MTTFGKPSAMKTIGKPSVTRTIGFKQSVMRTIGKPSVMRIIGKPSRDNEPSLVDLTNVHRKMTFRHIPLIISAAKRVQSTKAFYIRNQRRQSNKTHVLESEENDMHLHGNEWLDLPWDGQIQTPLRTGAANLEIEDVPEKIMEPQTESSEFLQHRQPNSLWYGSVPGLKVLVPYSSEDARGLLKAAITDPDPVHTTTQHHWKFIEHHTKRSVVWLVESHILMPKLEMEANGMQLELTNAHGLQQKGLSRMEIESIARISDRLRLRPE
ncbi:Pyruvate dehydrogenase E1 component subunit beta [Cynara cardunculus var. scolymus]|uniref:Pyruvate dehydrogenase E1 component subunit beta n=1 Tax=Cynara cardunculus var. scolymus TaxID=59895 RepID=A0A103Y7T1_CYNCS|nr:Pyruvate dehydrogenase E1 component subunit beta [Cynara cardunculus var. scolymus]